MATTAELMHSLRETLGRNTAFWTDDELIQNGLNPAQALLVLRDPTQCTRRVVVSLVVGQGWIDLRSVAPRCIALRSLHLGTMPADVHTPTAGVLRPLTPTARASLSVRGAWLLDVGTPTQYYRHGRYLLGLYPRPALPYTLTLTFRSLPRALSLDEQAREPELAPATHSLIADVAAPVLLIKEGMQEAQRAAQTLQALLGTELLMPMLKALRTVQQLTAEEETAHAAAQ